MTVWFWEVLIATRESVFIGSIFDGSYLFHRSYKNCMSYLVDCEMLQLPLPVGSLPSVLYNFLYIVLICVDCTQHKQFLSFSRAYPFSVTGIQSFVLVRSAKGLYCEPIAPAALSKIFCIVFFTVLKNILYLTWH